MRIEEIPVENIVGYSGNPRKNDNAVNYVANSIKEFGFKQPIVIDKNNEIVAGHTRLKAAIKLHMKTVPCIRADDLTDKQIRAYRIADNRTAEFATWDMEKLAIEKQELEGTNFDLSLFGFPAPFKPQKREPIIQDIEDEYTEDDFLSDVYSNETAETAEEHEARAEMPNQTNAQTSESSPSGSPKQPIYSRCPKCGRIHIIG